MEGFPKSGHIYIGGAGLWKEGGARYESMQLIACL